jgi:hypothetical protein
MPTAAFAIVLTCASCLLGPIAAPTPAFANGVDGISDQNLPLWATGAAGASSSPLGTSLVGSPFARIAFARYVVQWDAMSEPSAGQSALGDYRERYEAWLATVRALALTPVLALTSYDGVRPASQAAYAGALRTLLVQAGADGLTVPYVEAWNEPNGQGVMPATRAAAVAGWADGLCQVQGCEVIAGDLLDAPGALAYERRYLTALPFAARLWGIHPYVSVISHSDEPSAVLERELPAGVEVWVTEVGSYWCVRGRRRGQAAQAQDARYLLDGLLPSLPIEPAHVFYYGVSYAPGELAPCTPDGASDTELYGPDGRPRPAAGVVFQIAAATATILAANPFAD